MDLSRVTILVKTLLRDQHLYEAVDGIRRNMPEVKILVVDDGDSVLDEKQRWVKSFVEAGGNYVKRPFDSGFGHKSNMAIHYCDTPYLLIASDDFDFMPREARHGIEMLTTVLDNVPDAAIASGRVNGCDYQFYLNDRGTEVYEIPFSRRGPGVGPLYAEGIEYYYVDLTVNYSLIRKSILGFDEKQVHWDDDVKIGGGEHGAFFVDVKRAGHKVVWVPGVEIREQRGKGRDPRYHGMRKRAGSPERPCFVRRGILRYGDDYISPDYKAAQ